MEVHHLPPNAAQTAFAIANALYHKANPRPTAFVIFSDVISETPSRGKELAAYLKRVKCGQWMESPILPNPKTGNMIQVWILALDHENFRKWYQEELANRVSSEIDSAS